MKATPRHNLFFTILLQIVFLSGFSQVSETGMASFYSDKFEGKITASGEPYKASKMTAAHRTIAFGTQVKVTNLSNKKTVTVTINDRGPFVKDRIIDLSKAAAEKLDYIDQGVTRVKIEVLKK